ncbi:MAG: CHAT domain-containing protein, partial [Bacteroidota bacterium]
LRNISKAPDLENQILVWRQAIQGYQLTGSNKDALANIYRESAYDLYQKLVAPIQEDLKNVASLLIVTSGVLDLLPFEALLTGRSEQEDFRKLPYFLADYNLSYSYSASLQFMLQAQPMSGQGLGAFAPTFKGDQGWSALSCSGSMLADILPSWNGQLWQDQEPTIEAFRREAQRFQLLHLATHAQANANEGDFSFVVFSDGQGGYDSLFTKDLYLLDLEAELVILSACETALGTLYNSEGVISLARGFHYAGARSVLTTLWSINESANCSLMEDFYQHLADGKTKAAALHSAKTDYLKAADSRSAHPVYWAGFQLLGNERPVRSGNRWWWWLLGAVLVFGSVGAWRLRK